MPVNNPTHAHGQGYTDLNFMIPELATNIKFTKGTYYANQGDFASVGSVHLSYLNRIDNQINVTAGNFGFERVFCSRVGRRRDRQPVGCARAATL